ncbi:MAG: hypothetical protein WCP01_12325 [Methylococcaceae bacterium]
MRRDIKSADDWFGEFHQIQEGIAKTRSTVEGLSKWVWDNVVAKDVIPPQMPSEVSEAIATLDQQLSVIAQTSDNLRWYFCRNAIDKYLGGQQLAREEFYLLAAQGIMIIPSESGFQEAYEEFSHFLYEDNEQRGYISPSEQPDPPPVPTEIGGWTQRVGLRIGIVPEVVRTSFLRPDQKDFFKKFRPNLFSRFRKD